MADERVTYGGQAVIEGVMMRGPRYFAVACRKPNGEVLVEVEKVPAFFTRYAWARWPFMRGVFALADSLVLGMKALTFSANLAVQEVGKAEAPATPAPSQAPLRGEKVTPPDSSLPPVGPITQALLAPLQFMLAATGEGSINSIAVTGSAFIGLAGGIALFFLLPTALAGAGWVTALVGTGIGPRLVEGAIRVIMVLGYIAGIGLMPNVQRLFQYHGAEHKAINAWEAEGVVDAASAERASRIHPRCGTNFVLTVLLVKALIFTAIPFQSSVLLRAALRLAMLPVVASLAYEVIRLAGKYRDFAPLQWLVSPGLATQYLTTREPELPMIEVAVASLRGVMDREAADRPPQAVVSGIA